MGSVGSTNQGRTMPYNGIVLENIFFDIYYISTFKIYKI